MAYFNFCRLIKKYSRNFILLMPSEPVYTGGIADITFTETEMTGAILTKNRNKFYQDGGNNLEEGKVLYMLKPLAENIHNCRVVFDNNVYEVTVNRDNGNEAFTDVYCYNLKWVESFDKSKQC